MFQPLNVDCFADLMHFFFFFLHLIIYIICTSSSGSDGVSVLLYWDANGRQTSAHPGPSTRRSFLSSAVINFILYWLIWFSSAVINFLELLCNFIQPFRRSTAVHVCVRWAWLEGAWS